MSVYTVWMSAQAHNRVPSFLCCSMLWLLGVKRQEKGRSSRSSLCPAVCEVLSFLPCKKKILIFVQLLKLDIRTLYQGHDTAICLRLQVITATLQQMLQTYFSFFLHSRTHLYQKATEIPFQGADDAVWVVLLIAKTWFWYSSRPTSLVFSYKNDVNSSLEWVIEQGSGCFSKQACLFKKKGPVFVLVFPLFWWHAAGDSPLQSLSSYFFPVASFFLKGIGGERAAFKAGEGWLNVKSRQHCALFLIGSSSISFW